MEFAADDDSFMSTAVPLLLRPEPRSIARIEPSSGATTLVNTLRRLTREVHRPVRTKDAICTADETSWAAGILSGGCVASPAVLR
jgi:hypothetical protein